MKTKLLLLLIIFISCSDVNFVTKENYNQIKMDMPQSHVTEILEDPKMTFAFIMAYGTIEIWYYREDKKIIDIYFLEYKVIRKRWRDLDTNEIEKQGFEVNCIN